MGSPAVSQVAQTIQLSVAPVFLLAGTGAFLNVCAGRLARVVDRARAVEELVLKSRGPEHDRLIEEIHVLDKRISVINVAIFLTVLSAVLICMVVVLLFLSELVNAHFGTLIALLFIASMISIGVGFAIFIYETRLGSRAVHIRNEILYHEAGDEEQNRRPH
ncbi:DUF2721 domain-containing protein [Sphingobium sp. H33]|uniref:DUF2721 domain-containing protein n=1 Tax=Sphingobium nicotianae TaxID=2782607 RepID=A0A9X1ISN6_9SPHN|nr:DUF2721 domain-containing protein [Sphingobium nicotianae]MBT2188415.1 DUF2721 domain-containing protein [Sphingobium nicotianae]